jgi:putative heme iron utilization protein
MSRIVLAFFLCLATIAPTQANQFGQKKILISNATPYQILEFFVFDAKYGLVTGSIDAWNSVTVYVEENSCVFELSALTPTGHLYAHTLDTCTESSSWVLRSDISL